MMPKGERPHPRRIYRRRARASACKSARRPVTAIRNGDQDGNDATERDAAWSSFNPTPLHPEYPSQATINAMIASAVLESVFGPLKAIPFTATDVRDPKRTRQFASLADMAEEHFRANVSALTRTLPRHPREPFNAVGEPADQAIFCRRRHQPRRPPLAKITRQSSSDLCNLVLGP